MNSTSAAQDNHVVIEAVTKTYNDSEQPAVNRLSLNIRQGEFFGLLGPSGCGKTTTLNMVAGFVTPDEGKIWIDGKDVTSVPSNRRGTVMVFQDYALFPHMTVSENISYGLKVRKWNRQEATAQVRNIMTVVGLDGYADRYPRQLSGGQQQRVALARSLAIEPALVLLDEPLSNLDARLRGEMRLELRRLLKLTGVTAVFVTHDQEEAFSLCDRVAILDRGNLDQLDEPKVLYTRPANRRVAEFLGRANYLEARLTSSAGGAGRVQLAETGQEIDCSLAEGASATVGDEGSILIRPEAISVGPEGSDGALLHGKISELEFLGPSVHYFVDTSAGTKVFVSKASSLPMFNAGDTVALTWPREHALFMSNENKLDNAAKRSQLESDIR